MKYTPIFAAFILLLGAVELRTLRRAKRVIGGIPAHDLTCPHIVLLSDEDEYFHCGAAIISESHLLTTAHCLESYDSVNEIAVHIGYGLPGNNDARITKVESFILHPNYNPTELTNNIAILKLEERLELNWKVRAPCIFNKDRSFAGAKATFCGYGVTENNNHNGTLHTAILDVIDMDECRKRHDFTISDDNICTRTDGKAICALDQGSPLIYYTGWPLKEKPILIGLASWTKCEAGEADVFTSVTQFHDWILQNAKGSKICSF